MLELEDFLNGEPNNKHTQQPLFGLPLCGVADRLVNRDLKQNMSPTVCLLRRSLTSAACFFRLPLLVRLQTRLPTRT
jgi:hypothetical protein